MSKNKKKKKTEEELIESKIREPVEGTDVDVGATPSESQAVPPQEDEDDIVVEDPGDCIGHWADCEECKECDLEEECESMTKFIHGEENAEQQQ